MMKCNHVDKKLCVCNEEKWPRFCDVKCYKCNETVFRCLMSKEGYLESLKPKDEYNWMCRKCGESQS